MSISQQKLNSIAITQLKGLKDLTINLDGSNLTAIMGPNGSGKSTILHALACSFKAPPHESSLQNQFYQFFTPTTDSTWAGSKFSIDINYRENESIHENEEIIFSKNLDRWNPKTDRRPVRSVRYIRIDTCVPVIENEKNRSMVKYSTSPQTDHLSEIIKKKAGYILNRDYTAFNILVSKKSRYIGVEYNKKKYSALSMGAGEQRVFRILSEVFNAPKYSLILIDELDILLHEFAIKRLMEVLNEQAEEKKLQVIFTTHSPVLFNMTSLINVRHIWQTPNKTLCLNETKPDAIYRITGKYILPLEVFVEDDLAQTIVAKVCSELDIKRFVSIKPYGPVDNCFTLASGILLSEGSIENILFVMDGDKYRTEKEIKERIKKVLTGTTPEHDQLRLTVQNSISKFTLPINVSPEEFIWNIIKDSINDNEIVACANDIQMVDNNHKYINDIIERIGFSNRAVGLNEIVNLFSKLPAWSQFIEPVKNWLHLKKSSLIEISDDYLK